MATFASVFSRMLPLIAGGERNEFKDRMTSRTEPCALRAMPNEDIHLFIKRIDNNRVIRTEDKQATATLALALPRGAAEVGLRLGWQQGAQQRQRQSAGQPGAGEYQRGWAARPGRGVSREGLTE